MVSSGQCTCVPWPSQSCWRPGMVVNTGMDVREVGPLGINMYQQGGALRILSAALGKAKVTAFIESASKAEKAITAKSKVLEPMAYGKGGSRSERVKPKGGVGTLPQEGEHVHNGSERRQAGKVHTPSEGHREGHVRTWIESE